MQEIKSFHVSVQPIVSRCSDFENISGEKKKMTVVIAPIKLQTGENNAVLISYGCSLGESCINPYCRYARKMIREIK